VRAVLAEYLLTVALYNNSQAPADKISSVVQSGRPGYHLLQFVLHPVFYDENGYRC